MNLPNCSYCERANARWQAVGRINRFYCGPRCLDRDLFGAPPAPWWAHIPGLRWLLERDK